MEVIPERRHSRHHIPTVAVKRTHPNRTYPGHELWIIDCPYCGREHTHGDGPGHRVAHCVTREDSRAGYIIVAPEATRETIA